MSLIIKPIFLDFDGCFNSAQQAPLRKRYLQSWMGRFRWFLAHLLYHPYGLFPYGGPYGIINTGKMKYNPWYWFFWNTRRHIIDFYLHAHKDLCPIATSNLRLLLEADPQVMIVVSSSWRKHGIKYCRHMLKKAGIDPKRVIDVTGNGVGLGSDAEGNLVEGNGRRGCQIQEWLTRNTIPEDPKYVIDRFAIIDDDSDMEHLMWALVHIDNAHGFMYRDMIKVAKLLDVADYKDDPI